MSQSINELRLAIDAVDKRLVELLVERAAIVHKIGHLKSVAGEPVLDLDREHHVLKRISELNPGPYTDEHLHAIFREIMSASRDLEGPVQVAYLGPPHTFSHQAALQHFGRSAELVPMGSFNEIFDYVDRSHGAAGVVPIENTTSGTIGETLDLFTTHNAHIKAEINLPISHNLLASSTSETWTTIYSHPQALAQCRGWLDRIVPGIPTMEVSSTAEAARRAGQEPETAAIGPLSAAEANNLEVVHQDIQDLASNQTRFYVLGDAPAPASGKDKVALMVAVSDRVGALHDVLGHLREKELNLSFIQSRPSRLKSGDYLFFLELEGHPDEPAVTKAINTLVSETVVVRILGAWAA